MHYVWLSIYRDSTLSDVPISQLGNHLYSNPRNPIIAKIFRLVNLSETIGYGFDMMNEWKEITGNDVTFESDICNSTVTFWLEDVYKRQK